MTVYSGSEGVLEIESDTVKETVGEDEAADTDVVYTTSHYPIVNSSSRIVTDTPADISVYRDNVALTPVTDFTLDGSEGEVTVLVVNSGDDITISYSSKETVGSWKSIEIGHKNNIKRVHVGGSRVTYALKEMLVEQDVKFGEIFIDGRRMKMIMAMTYPTTALPELTVRTQTKSTGGVQIEATGVKLNSAKLAIKLDDIVGVDVDGFAMALAITTT